MPEKDSLIPEDLGSDREKEIGQHIGYRYDVNLLPDYQRLTPFLKKYIGLCFITGFFKNITMLIT